LAAYSEIEKLTQQQSKSGADIVAIAARLFFENAWHFKDIFREFEDFDSF
jgi:hypothetical protein